MHIQPSTAQTIRISLDGLNELLDRIERKLDRGNRRMHQLRADWTVDVEAGWPYMVQLTLDLVEARHLQQHFGEQDGEALKAISRAFGVPPRNWNAYGYHPGCAGIGAAHNREHTSY